MILFQWQDTLMLSLQNFLSVVFASVPPPKLADLARTNERIQRLRDENRLLKAKVFDMVKQSKRNSAPPASPQGPRAGLNLPEIRPPDDVMDDFFIIAQEVCIHIDA